MSLSTLEVLRAARSLIDTPEKWWKPGKGSGGTCALVALQRVSVVSEIVGGSGQALARHMDVPAACRIPDFNNSHTHAEVLAAFDCAIASEEARAQEFTVEPEREPVTA